MIQKGNCSNDQQKPLYISRKIKKDFGDQKERVYFKNKYESIQLENWSSIKLFYTT